MALEAGILLVLPPDLGVRADELVEPRDPEQRRSEGRSGQSLWSRRPFYS